ncbi:hypothetical protein BP6252_00070 [Coleophoma cylindrospora]|uniref:Uncharacterized protein n=1 Tax=Coleophoma cylindrospora TaxID=1849047 RepID=A0A3D8SQG3_9HELO|nr:hypothetical protein BP6252_00070 [Coleophoma cylindrospora]
MARRPVPPPLPLSSHPRAKHAYGPHQPSLLSQPPTITSPRTPLTPPPRLHLRTILPSPPISPSKASVSSSSSSVSRTSIPLPLPPPPPQEPCPWIWRCHICQTKYALGVTRRCLLDGHYFCSFAEPAIAETEGVRKKKKKKVSCRAEFDYQGWEEWNSWRAEIEIVTRSKKGARSLQHGAEERSKDCWHECAFPSQCFAALREKALRKHEGRQRAKSATPVVNPDYILNCLADPALNLAKALQQLAGTTASSSSPEASSATGSRGMALATPTALRDAEGRMELIPGPAARDSEEEEDRREEMSVRTNQQLADFVLTTDIALVTPVEAPESPPSSPLKMFCESVDWDGDGKGGDAVSGDGVMRDGRDEEGGEVVDGAV